MPRKRKGNPVHGWVVLDKPLNMTSTQAVGKTRWLNTAQKAGHAGTLDPLATGILPIALGEATKTVPFTMDADKVYQFTVTWGENTDSWDAEGAVTETSDIRPPREDIEAALPEFIGHIEQIPPKYSAIKVDGKRAYDLMRDGKSVELRSRSVFIERLNITDCNADSVTLEMTCGKGTYVRSLARDLAARLGTCGHVTYLRRTRVGPFTLDASFSLDVLENLPYEARVSEGLLPVETALDDIPVLAVTEDQAFALKQGRAIVSNSPNVAPTEWVLAMSGGRVVALCNAQSETISPKRVFNL